MNHLSISLTKFWFVLFLFCQSAIAESLSISNQDLINMVQNPVPELETDCLECKNKKEKDLVEKLTENVKTDWKSTDIPKFCEEVTKYKMAEGVFEMPEAELEKKVKSNDFDFSQKHSNWVNAIYPSYGLRKANHQQILSNIANRNGYPIDKNVDIRKFLKGLPDSDPAKDFWDKNQAEKFQNYETQFKGKIRDQDKSFKQANSAITALCASYGLKRTNNCKKGVNEIVDIMTDHGGVSLYPVIKEVLSDPDYTKASQLTAIKIQDKIEKGGIPVGNLYDDIYQSFLSLGLNSEQAEEKSFNLLGVFSTHGANTHLFLWRFITKETAPLLYSLSLMGTGMSVLNSASQSSGHLYSYPKEVKGECDNGKPYHFWMSAFLARRIAKKTGDVEAAISSTYLAQLGYQMRSETYGRDPSRPFTVDTYDSGNNKIRLDLAWAGAGAVYGAAKAEKEIKKDLNVDEGLRQLLEDAGNKKSLSKAEAEKKWQGSGVKGYFRWRNIFSPDSSLDYYKKAR